jgi:alpha-galactosidase
MRCTHTSGAPVVCLYGADGINRLTFAVGPRSGVTEILSGMNEESGEFSCGFRVEGAGEVTLRVDRRSVPWWQAVGEVSDWWASLPELTPMRVPPAARVPVYSTWYSFHQQLEPEALLRQCRLARELGCGTLIVDDGWQTLDDNRSYAYCGDWEPERLSDMGSLVADVHAMGMKCLLWYSVPYVGIHSRAASRFEGKFLAFSERKGAWTLDPRYPDVRRHLVDLYLRAMEEWGLDGFKLDFVDAFPMEPQLPETRAEEMDITCVGEAARRLLTEVRDALQSVNPEVMIEYRQSYIGPVMRTCGNIFRAGDCPNDGLRNRIAILDLRVLSGETAVHSDMVMWHPGEPVASAALQLLNVLFSTLQLSVKLDELPEDHLEMLRFWITFMREHEDVLLRGNLRSHHPELNYPWVEAEANNPARTPARPTRASE